MHRCIPVLRQIQLNITSIPTEQVSRWIQYLYSNLWHLYWYMPCCMRIIKEQDLKRLLLYAVEAVGCRAFSFAG